LSRRKRTRRTQSEILISILKCTPSRKGLPINTIADKCNTNWRTAKRNIEMLAKAGIVKRVKEPGKRRAIYRKK